MKLRGKNKIGRPGLNSSDRIQSSGWLSCTFRFYKMQESRLINSRNISF